MATSTLDALSTLTTTHGKALHSAQSEYNFGGYCSEEVSILTHILMIGFETNKLEGFKKWKDSKKCLALRSERNGLTWFTWLT